MFIFYKMMSMLNSLLLLFLLLKLVGAYYERQGNVFSSACGLAIALTGIKLENGSERGGMNVQPKSHLFSECSSVKLHNAHTYLLHFDGE